MSLYDRLKKTATIFRLDSNKDYQNIGSIGISIHTLDDTEKAFFDGEISQGFKGYTEIYTDVQNADRLEVDSIIYDVVSVQEFNFGSFPHKKLILERPQGNSSS